MKKLFSITLVLCLALCSVAQRADTSKTFHFPYRNTTIDVGLVTGFGLKVALSGDSGTTGFTLPALIFSSHYQKPKSNFTRSAVLGLQVGMTGRYTNPITNESEIYNVTSVTIGYGYDYNWVSNPSKQVFSGASFAWRITQIKGPDQYPLFRPVFGSYGYQVDFIGIRGYGYKKKIGYNVVLGAGYKGILRIGFIESF